MRAACIRKRENIERAWGGEAIGDICERNGKVRNGKDREGKGREDEGRQDEVREVK